PVYLPPARRTTSNATNANQRKPVSSIIAPPQRRLVGCLKSSLKRDGPVFFSSAPVKVAGDERTIIAIVAPHVAP
ncbi:MAG: hypothetical protein ABSF34_15730, partial [Verrucomicrobiota bacterium]